MALAELVLESMTQGLKQVYAIILRMHMKNKYDIVHESESITLSFENPDIRGDPQLEACINGSRVGRWMYDG